MTPSKGGLPDSVKQGFKFTRSSNTVPNIQPGEQGVQETTEIATVEELLADLDRADKADGINVSTVNTALSTETSNTAIPQLPSKGKNKVGRPRGVDKVKKTVYLSTGIENLQKARLQLAKQADIILDESQITDLALALLNITLAEQNGIKRVLEVLEGLHVVQD